MLAALVSLVVAGTFSAAAATAAEPAPTHEEALAGARTAIEYLEANPPAESSPTYDEALAGARPAVAYLEANPPSPSPTATPNPTPAGQNRSGVPWASGVFAHDSAKASSFQTMRGAPVDVIGVHGGRDSWAAAMHPWPLDQTEPLRLQPGVRLEWSLPPFMPDKGVNATQAAEWRRFGEFLVARGEPDAIVNIGKEMTLQNPWACTPSNSTAWIARFQEAVTALRTVPGQKFTYAWTVAEGRTQTGIPVEQCYPGDAYVDIVGVDYYDQWEPIRNASEANARFARPYGLDQWLAFAKQHGKQLALAEWGVSSGSQWAGHAGGDNPVYVEQVLAWLDRNRAHVAYDSWFEEPVEYLASALMEPTPNDQSRAAYVREIAELRE